MMRGLLLVLLVFSVLPAQAGELWNKLWRNADQRGEALLKQGDARNAANEYADPARKAYAKLQAGDYQGAAKDLGPLHDSDADYNRGNALAYSGDLQGALAAYDAALKTNPDNQDAKHNRDLVEQQLKKQSQKSGQQPQNNDQGKSGNQPLPDKQQGDKQSGDKQGQAQNQSGKQGQQDVQQGKVNQDKASEGKNFSNNQNNGKGSQGEKATGSQGEQAANRPQQAAQQAKPDSAASAAEQAKRDAEASLGQSAEDKNAKDGTKGASDALMPRKTENQLAQEQWLRSIPDDPAGLLRRKFMIEHLIRQQKAKQ